MSEMIVCGEDNAKAFNAQLRAVAPEFHALAKELFSAGLIDGLRRATLISPPDLGEYKDTEIEKSANTCEQCAQWARDSVGDGTGIGHCHAGDVGRLHWPKQSACRQFEAAL